MEYCWMQWLIPSTLESISSTMEAEGLGISRGFALALTLFRWTVCLQCGRSWFGGRAGTMVAGPSLGTHVTYQYIDIYLHICRYMYLPTYQWVEYVSVCACFFVHLDLRWDYFFFGIIIFLGQPPAVINFLQHVSRVTQHVQNVY